MKLSIDFFRPTLVALPPAPVREPCDDVAGEECLILTSETFFAAAAVVSIGGAAITGIGFVAGVAVVAA